MLAKPRNNSIDVLKGITALLMILAHSAYFAGKGSDESFSFIIGFINLTTFTVLLFLSGTGMFLSYLRPDLSEEEFKEEKGKIVHKAFKLLLSYYLIALIGIIPDILTNSSDLISKLVRVLLFIDIPSYVEFLIPFMFFYMLIYFLRGLVKSISNSLIYTVIFSILLYLVGAIYYSMDVPHELTFLKSIFVGHDDWYRFPILQYSCVFLIGAFYGKLIAYKDQAYENKLKNIMTLVLFLIASIFSLVQLSLNSNGIDLNRWPPDPMFLIAGLSYTTLMLFIIETYFHELKFKFLNYVGRNLFDFYIIHLVLLFIFKYAFNPVFTSNSDVLIYYIFIVIFGSILVYLSNSHSILNPIRERLSLRSFDSVYFRLFYIGVGVCIVLVMLLRFAQSYDMSISTWVAGAFIDINYRDKVNSNFSIDASVDRKMLLKIESDDPSFDDYRSTIFDISVNNKGFDYLGVDILMDGVLVTSMSRNPIDRYNYRVEALGLDIGTHRLEARITGADLTSLGIEISVSYPLYVTWTIDWEGFDISDANIRAMERVSSEYDMPMVQLVTPRVFIASEVSSARKSVLKQWVMDRYMLGDEIGMHLHMHYDLFTYCGLSYRTEPKWDSRANGHDVPTSAYEQSEFSSLLSCALSYFDENSFPKPVTYRAGGWFIDLKNLKVLPDHGFKIDTSARDEYEWGYLKGFWDVDVSAKPYMISNYDQNIGDNEDNFDLVEVPNNGSDSTNNSYELMKERFDLNYKYKGIPLDSMQIVTFMSHPHWFTKYDEDKMHKLLAYIEDFKADDDKGPVVFTTIDRIYDLRADYDR